MTPATRIVENAESVPTVEHIRADQIKIDERVQRALIPARAKKLTDELDLDALGVVTVSLRDSGIYVAIDGQHRIAALLANEMGEWEVICNVYRKLSTAQEAALFRRLNDTRKITAYDDYTKGLVEGDPEIVAINGIVQQHGLKVGTYGGDGWITAVTKLRKLYQAKDGLPAGENLNEALDVAIKAWGPVYSAMEQSVLGGLALVLRKYPEADRASLIEGLAKFGGGPAGILGKGRLLREIKSSSVERLCAEVIVETYNKRRRTGKLDPL